MNNLINHINNDNFCFGEKYPPQNNVENSQEIFLAMVTHDLKTPINAVLLAIELLLKNKTATSENFEYKLLCDILNTSKYMKNLVENLLLKYKSEKNEIKLQLEQHSLENIILKCIEEVHYIITDKEQKIKFKNHTKASICNVDFIEIKRIINNLLANANQYSPTKTTITIELDENEDSYFISIINKTTTTQLHEFSKDIFDKYIEHSQCSKTVNTGLGLYICKKIVELHQGKIYFKNLSGNKNCFRFSLPKHPTAQK